MINFIITYWFEVLLFVMAAVPSIIIFSIKGRISHWFNKDLKSYEQKLELLKMQKSLQYSNVYTKRAEIIAKIYENISRVAMYDTLLQSSKFNSQQDLDAALKEYGTHIFESQLYFATNGIYLTQSIREKLGKLHDQVSKELIANKEDVLQLIKENTLQNILNAPDVNKDEILSELITEFQEILGVNESKPVK